MESGVASGVASSVASGVVRGTLLESGPDRIVLGLPGTDYRLHLNVGAPITAKVGSHLTGRIDVHARRIDVTRTGGRFIDPVYGRPRTIQGRVVETGIGNATIVVDAAVLLHVRVRPPQKASDFEVGSIVNFSVDPGAVFVPCDNQA